MVWPANPQSARELPHDPSLSVFGNGMFNETSLAADEAVAHFVAQNCQLLDQITGGNTTAEARLGNLLIELATLSASRQADATPQFGYVRPLYRHTGPHI
jgi:hypothetical protein